jgi:RHH-type transcriptional regulator, rel operon repressor / antitoxin RelB
VASANLTIQVSKSDRERLEALAQTTGRSESLLASEAISEYLAVQEWQIAGTKIAIAAIDREEWIAIAPCAIGFHLGTAIASRTRRNRAKRETCLVAAVDK